MPDPQTSSAPAKVSVDGKQIKADDLPAYVEFKKPSLTQSQAEQEQWLYSSDDIEHFNDLQQVSRAINNVKKKKAVCNQLLKVARKNAAGAKYFYERAKRRQMVTVSGSSDRIRVAMAEIYTEELETDYIVTQTIEEEYKSLLRTLTKEAEDLKEISYNIRKELELLKVQ